AGYYGGWVDAVIMRIVDIMFAFPALLLAIVIVTVLGQYKHKQYQLLNSQ
ncbi:unnamed protein product, partial [marine sediment metagenome]